MGYHHGFDAGYRMMLPRWTPLVRTLIIANVAVFVLQHLVYAFSGVELSHYLGVRSDKVLGELWLWQVVTYMFLHSRAGVFHLLFNMLALYFFGTQLEQMLGRRHFSALYFGGGVVGGLAYCITQHFSQQPAIGASAAVMAILVVCAIHFPDQIVFLFFIPVRMRWLAIGLVGVDLLYSIGPRFTGVAHTAHLGGALYGYLFWRFGPAVGQLLDRLDDRKREQRAKRLADNEQRLDELLDKISRKGFDSLSRRERDFLTEQSKRRRDRGYRS